MGVPEREDPFDGDFSAASLRSYVWRKLGRGILVGLVLFVGFLGSGAALVFVSSLLPPESKEAVDPTPDSFSSYIVEQDKESV
ncbi:MAG: hypothetical protein AAGK67_04060 [Pseudomonadota bacterium]